ncbi:UPF0738 family protein [Sutcliffiella rhizosphaerae]|uniref:Uncharacterized protein n=1 Tax=Sutcliffiella rhizosphaerae TaxID=2880967 RepID=A0ABN8AC93_9BACI|nr:hypothetical protein [Sutcliffiella rhizosphaerae]CAG9622831.1 hypothetical protein BACCIP111883_03622 [Sutcliffiella rhizosphaerae]
MQKRIEIKQSSWNEQQLLLEASPVSFPLDGVIASNQMLVDSDNLAFIYKLETASEFLYVSIKDDYWADINQAIQEKKAVVLVTKDVALLLTNMEEEIDYLIENIRDNANYGEEMEKRVNEIF